MNRASALYHEQLYRTAAVMQRLRETQVTVCGAGALGGNLMESLARQGFARLRLIDRDRVEERNLSTQPYYRSDIGAFKAKILANALYRALGVTIEARTDTLTAGNADRLLAGSDIVVDTFDNSGSRRSVADCCRETSVACLHAGLAADYAEVLWNPVYRVPSPTQDDLCDYPLARNLVTLTVGIACESLIAYIATGESRNLTLTLADLAVRPFAG